MTDVLERICISCGTSYPLTSDYWYKNKQDKKHGLARECKQCACDRAREWRVTNPDKARLTHQRWAAENTEYIREYKREQRQRNAESIREYQRQYCESHREEAKQRTRAWIKENPDRVIANNKAYYATNKERHQLSGKRWTLNNPDKVAAIKRAYIERNPDKRKESANSYARSEKGRISHQRRRARRDYLPDTMTDQQWYDALAYWKYGCAACGETNIIHADHWIPLSSEHCPGTVASNIVPLCRHCNLSKKNRPPHLWVIKKHGVENGPQILERVEAYFAWLI